MLHTRRTFSSSHFRQNFSSTMAMLKTAAAKMHPQIRLHSVRTWANGEEPKNSSQFSFVIPKNRAAAAAKRVNLAEEATGSSSGNSQSPPPPPLLTFEEEQMLEWEQNEQSTTSKDDGNGNAAKNELMAKAIGRQYNSTGRLNLLLTKFAFNQYFDLEQKRILREAAAKLYYSCADGSNYIALHKEFGMPDNYYSWFRLTFLHVWMGLVRMQQSLEAYSYCLYRHQISALFFKDASDRYKAVFENDTFAKMARSSRIRKLYFGFFMHSIFELDEGFLRDDQHFAGAVWCSLFMFDQNLDIIHLNRAVRYIRSVMNHLDGQDTDKILLEGIETWEVTGMRQKMEQQGEPKIQRQF